MKKLMTAVTLALFAAPVFGWAQGAGQPQNPPPQTSQPPSTTVKPTMTLAGCLYREDQVPGRKPNVAEQAGVLEDYILADASVAGGATAGAGTGGGTPASGNMYKVEGPPDEKLKALVGKRVEVTGRIDPERGPTGTAGKPRPDSGLGPDDINLPEFEASSIRETTGKCPTTPTPRR